MTSPIFEIPQCECKVCGYCRTYLENFQWGLDLKEKIGKLKCPNRTMTHPVCPKGQNCLSWRGTDVFEGSTCPNRIFEHATCTQGPNCGLCQGHKFQGPKVYRTDITHCHGIDGRNGKLWNRDLYQGWRVRAPGEMARANVVTTSDGSSKAGVYVPWDRRF